MVADTKVTDRSPIPGAPDPEAVSPADPTARVRGFVCPSNPNMKRLIRPGVAHRVVDSSSPTGYKDWGRQGDIWIQFHNGYWTGGRSEGDAERIAWLEKNAASDKAIVKDVEDPQARVWAELIEGQQVTGRRDPTVNPSIDVNAALRGEVAITQGGEALDRVLQTVRTANNEGEPQRDPVAASPPPPGMIPAQPQEAQPDPE